MLGSGNRATGKPRDHKCKHYNQKRLHIPYYFIPIDEAVAASAKLQKSHRFLPYPVRVAAGPVSARLGYHRRARAAVLYCNIAYSPM